MIKAFTLSPGRTGLGSWMGRQGLASKVALAAFVLALVAAIATLPIPYAGVLILGLGAAAVLAVRPEIGLLLLAFAVPYGNYKETIDEAANTTSGFDLTLTEPLVIVLVAMWLANGVRDRRASMFSAPLYLPILLFIGLVGFSLTTAFSLPASLKELVKWVALLAAYAYVVNNVGNRRRLALVLGLVFLAALSESLLGFFQFVAKAGPKGFAIGSYLRAFGTFGQPNPYAGYQAMAAAAAFGVVLYSLKRRGSRRPVEFSEVPHLNQGLVVDQASVETRHIASLHRVGAARNARLDVSRWLIVIAWLAFGACAAAIVMSLSRGAWLGLVVGLMVAIALSSRRALWLMVVGLIIVAIILALGLLQALPAQIGGRITEALSYFGVFDVRQVVLTPENWPLVERMAHWQAAWNMFEANPVLGVGVGNYAVAYPNYLMPGWKDPMGHAHNIYLNTLAEMGIVGLISYLLLLGCFFVYGFRVVARLGRLAGAEFERCIAIGLVATLAVLCVHNIFDNLFVHGMGVQIGLILGMLTVVDRIGRLQNNESLDSSVL